MTNLFRSEFKDYSLGSFQIQVINLASKFKSSGEVIRREFKMRQQFTWESNERVFLGELYLLTVDFGVMVEGEGRKVLLYYPVFHQFYLASCSKPHLDRTPLHVTKFKILNKVTTAFPFFCRFSNILPKDPPLLTLLSVQTVR